MQNRTPQTSDPMDRRKMLRAALFGSAVAGVSLKGVNAFGQEKPKAAAPAKAAASATGPNLSPPVVAVKGGKLRGLREGKTYSFLGVRYAEAERFGQPRLVQPWEGIKSAQVWGPCCPVQPQAMSVPTSLYFRTVTGSRTRTASISTSGRRILSRR